MASSNALMRAAQAWCTDTTKCTVMDPILAEAFAEMLDEEWTRGRPWGPNLSEEPDKPLGKRLS